MRWRKRVKQDILHSRNMTWPHPVAYRENERLNGRAPVVQNYFDAFDIIIPNLMQAWAIELYHLKEICTASVEAALQFRGKSWRLSDCALYCVRL